MEPTPLNVLIAAENALVANGLRHFLNNRFGSHVNASCTFDFKSCLRKVGESTDILVVDSDLDGRQASDVMRSARLINPHIGGVEFTSESDVASFIGMAWNSLSHASGQEAHPRDFSAAKPRS